MLRAIVSPMPLPPAGRCGPVTRKKRSKTSSKSSRVSPTPVSATVTAANSPTRPTVTATRSPRVGVRECVPEQVREHLRDPLHVDLDVDPVRRDRADVECDILGVELRPEAVGDGDREPRQVDPVELECDRTLLHPREGAEVGRQALQALRLVGDGGEDLLRRLEHTVEHPLDVAVDRRERRAHLVRDLGDELDPPALRVAQRDPRAG